MVKYRDAATDKQPSVVPDVIEYNALKSATITIRPGGVWVHTRPADFSFKGSKHRTTWGAHW